MGTVYRCKHCGLSQPRDERQRHLHWHQIMDRNVGDHFTEEHEAEVRAGRGAGVSHAEGSGRMGSSVVVATIAAIAFVLAAMALMRLAS